MPKKVTFLNTAKKGTRSRGECVELVQNEEGILKFTRRSLNERFNGARRTLSQARFC